jgi:type III pantothenate kinase
MLLFTAFEIGFWFVVPARKNQAGDKSRKISRKETTMLLAIDIGNTNIVLGGIEGEETLFTERLSTDTGKTDLEYALLFDTTLRIHSVDPASVSGAIIGSVVPPINSIIQAALQKVCSVQALIVGPGIRTGLNIRMDDPASVGADLIAGAVGALASYEPPLMVIDMGTATTLCVVDGRRDFIGGIIMPGIRVSLESLVSEASMLQGISLKMPRKVIGSNTVDAMRSGIMLGSASMLDGLIDRVCDELGEKATIIATGGWAPRVIPSCRHEIILDENLLLNGLRMIYERNRRS